MQLEIRINNAIIPTNPFVTGVFTNVIQAMIQTLTLPDTPREITIALKKESPALDQ